MMTQNVALLVTVSFERLQLKRMRLEKEWLRFSGERIERCRDVTRGGQWAGSIGFKQKKSNPRKTNMQTSSSILVYLRHRIRRLVVQARRWMHWVGFRPNRKNVNKTLKNINQKQTSKVSKFQQKKPSLNKKHETLYQKHLFFFVEA